jgi:dTDP-4-dehydrorhamnose reductase
MTSILLTGRDRQLGWELQRELSTLGDVVAFGRAGADLSDPDALRSVVRKVKPNVIVNAAAYTAVDKAEEEPELAMRVNGIAPGILAEEAKRLGALLVHYSTDYVFDGEKEGPYVEDDEPSPLSVYGKSKLAGEKAIQALGCRHFILRTSWIYGRRGKNFLLTMLKADKERDELKVVGDQFGAPTWSRLVAQTTAQILAQVLWRNDGIDPASEKLGTYHLTAAGSTSWHGFAEAIFATIPDSKNYKVRLVSRIRGSDWASPVKRPRNSVLSNENIKKKFGIKLPTWKAGLELCLG